VPNWTVYQNLFTVTFLDEPDVALVPIIAYMLLKQAIGRHDGE